MVAGMHPNCVHAPIAGSVGGRDRRDLDPAPCRSRWDRQPLTVRLLTGGWRRYTR
jgi:hypothetical protein